MNRLLLLLIACHAPFLVALSHEQEDRKKPAEIRILNAESMEAPYRGMDSDGIRLIGEVRLLHEEIHMSCDSAHRYSARNIVHAFGNVHINQGDTLHLYGDQLIYYGDRRFTEIRGNVILKDHETTLETESLDFDLERNFGYYPDRGVVTSGDNRLESRRGYYYADEKLFFFRDDVTITNPDYIIRSDTLRYNTETEVAYFVGPTTITGDETDIYCENGWYNTITDISQFNRNARVRNNNQTLVGDSIFYDNGRGFGEAFMNVEITDTVENLIVKGHYAWFNRDPEEMLVTGRALLIQMTDNDTLYLHADTLHTWLQAAVSEYEREPPDEQVAPEELVAPDEQIILEEQLPPDERIILEEQLPPDERIIPEELVAPDEHILHDEQVAPEEQLPPDERIIPEELVAPDETAAEITEKSADNVRILVAYYGVRFFSNQMQGKCDSLYYNMRDSVFHMFVDPVLWSDANQLSANKMELYLRNDEVDHIVMTNSSFIVSEEDDGLFNQIKGTNVTGFFRQGELYRVNVTGNAETLYYPADNGDIIGINKAMSASLVIFMKENKPDRIRFLNKVESVLHPMEELQGEERFLQGFRWLEEIRPQNSEDVFRR